MRTDENSHPPWNTEKRTIKLSDRMKASGFVMANGSGKQPMVTARSKRRLNACQKAFW
jgi:hypothetical protein